MNKDGGKIIPAPNAGGHGYNVESSFQTIFVVVMLLGGQAPGMASNLPISKIRFQNRKQENVNRQESDRFKTDDILVVAGAGEAEHKLLVSVKSQCKVSRSNKEFCKVVSVAFKDFQDPNFCRERDTIALALTCPADDRVYGLIMLCNVAKHQVDLESFKCGIQGREKDVYNIIKGILSGEEADESEIFKFLKIFIVLTADAGVVAGGCYPVCTSLLITLIQNKLRDIGNTLIPPDTVLREIWACVREYDAQGITLRADKLPKELQRIKEQYLNYSVAETAESVKKEVSVSVNNGNYNTRDLVVSMGLIGDVDISHQGDIDIINEIMKGGESE